MSVKQLLANYQAADLEEVLTEYLKDVQKFETTVLQEYPELAKVIQSLDAHMHNELLDPKQELAFHDGMMTMLQILTFIEGQQDVR